MSAQRLSLEQSPPLAVPLRFFLTGPLFSLLAAAAIAWGGADAFGSRWSPSILAATHLVTLGFLTMVMSGALLQVLPVIVGSAVPMPRLTAAAVHVPLAAGTLALAVGLGIGAPTLLLLGLPLLAAAIGVLLASAGYALWRAPADNAVVTAMRLALASLLATLLLGLTLGAALARGWALPLAALTDLHLQWGLIGWVGLLVAGVAIHVVPMFQTTPGYPVNLMRWMARLTFAALSLITVAAAVPDGAVRDWTRIGLAAMAVAFASVTLYLQSRRRRRQPDATLTLWRTAMASLLAAVAVWAAGRLLPDCAQAPVHGLVLGTLMVGGFAVSVVNGMLYKIVPFLAWLAMQNAAHGLTVPPNVKRILPDPWMQRQARLHLLALALMLGAAIWPQALVYPAAAAYAASSAFLWRNIAHVCRVHRRFVHTLHDAPAAQAGALP